MKRRTETDTQTVIIKALRLLGFVVGKTKTMGVLRKGVFSFDPYTFRGFPDLTCFGPIKKRFQLFFVEVKHGRNKQTDDQRLFEDYCRRAGTVYILAYGVKDVMEVVTGEEE